jgi:methylenetetrahydrofolate dehydrogenase (NADP+)/methenyltetrahydrofolate cyclohydrolase
VDVGINFVDGVMCGDVDYDEVSEQVAAITPVPGGVGTVTTSVLLKHTLESAERI